MFGMTPSCVVSAAPTTAALDRFMSRFRRFKERKSDLVVLLGKSELERHVETESFWRLCAASNVCHHSGAFLELHYGNRVGSLESRDRSLRNDVAVKGCPAARGKCLDLRTGALGTEGTRREIHVGAMDASLESQLSLSRAFPEVGSLRRGHWKRSRRLVFHLSACSGGVSAMSIKPGRRASRRPPSL